MKKVALLLLVIGIIAGLYLVLNKNQPKKPATMKFSLVEVKIAKDKLTQLYKIGIIPECSDYDIKGKQLIFKMPLIEKDIELLKQNSISHKVLQPDMAQVYAQRSQIAIKQGLALTKEAKEKDHLGMKLGSMGGAYTIEEYHSVLDNLYKKYQKTGIISAKKSIGKSFEKRDIYMIKISDNVDKDERQEEPGTLYTALHHSREVAGMMTVVYFMHYILENYPNDERVKNIVDKRQLYFIPMLNPDGYAFNQKYYPSGGGMWRKNRNGSGVDLNRNYGPKKFWNAPNYGSSLHQWHQAYRGTKAFSEPETRAIRDFLDNKKIHTAFNYHSYSNLLLHPYGVGTKVAHPLYKEMAQKMTQDNKYRPGTPGQLLYPVRGYSDDYFYTVTEKKGRIFAFTPEVGSRKDGFWPEPYRIWEIAEENIEPNLLLAEYAAKVADLEKKEDVKKPDNKKETKKSQ